MSNCKLVVLHVGSVTRNVASGVSVVIPQYLKYQNASDELQCALLNVSKRSDCAFEEEYLFRDVKHLDGLPHPFSIPDLIVFHEVYRPAFCKLSREARMRGIPYVVVPHGSLTATAQREKRVAKIILNRLFFNQYIEGASLIQFLSEREADQSDSLGVNSAVLGNGVDSADRIDCKKQNMILFLGRLDIQVKGLDLLLDAICEVSELLRARRYTVVVAGPGQRGSLEELVRMASAKGIGDIVSFPGLVHGEEKRVLFSQAKLYIQLSRTEALPTSILEAMAYGLPVIVTEGTSMKKNVERFGLGYGVNFDKRSVACAISNALGDEETLCITGDRARDYVRDAFSWSHVVARQIELYRSVACGG